MKDSFDNLPLKGGIRPPAGKTPMQGWDLTRQQKHFRPFWVVEPLDAD